MAYNYFLYLNAFNLCPLEIFILHGTVSSTKSVEICIIYATSVCTNVVPYTKKWHKTNYSIFLPSFLFDANFKKCF